MREPILVINAGSSSIKFSVFETMPDRSLSAGAHGQVDGLGAKTGTPARIEVADAQGRKLADADHRRPRSSRRDGRHSRLVRRPCRQ